MLKNKVMAFFLMALVISNVMVSRAEQRQLGQVV